MSNADVWKLVEQQFAIASKAVEDLQKIESSLALVQETLEKTERFYEAYPTAENLENLNQAKLLFSRALALAQEQKKRADLAVADAASILEFAKRAEGLSDAGDNPAGS